MVGKTLSDGILILSPLVPSDAEVWLAGEDEEQRRWFEAPRPAELSDVQRFIDACQESWRSSGSHRHWGVRSVDSGALLGGVDLRILDLEEVNLSYVVFPPFRRQGVALRSSRQALDYAASELGASRAVIKMLPGNTASRSLAIRLGASYVGEEPSDAGSVFEVFKVALRLKAN